jgi:hypothetical protein
MSFNLRRKARAYAVLGALATALALVPGARPGSIPQLLTLGPVTVLNGTAIVSGTVGGSGAGSQISLNGQALNLDAAGHFAGVINLDGASSLDFAVGNSTGQLVDFTVPLALAGPGGIIPGSVVDAVEQAGAKLLQPVGGFVGGQPLAVAGSVADKGQLASLAVNGTDVMHLLGSDQSFTVPIPGTTKEITLSATDTRGVTETTHYKVLDATGLLATPLGTSVAAANAVGLKITKVRYYTKGVTKTKRVRMVVTVKDRRGYLVRGAKITIRSKAAGRLTRRSQAKTSTKVGQASFVLRVKSRTLGKRLVMVTVARTPTAKAAKTTSVRLAKARQSKKHRH